MAALAIPVGGAILEWLLIGATAITVGQLISKSNLGAKMKQWISTNAATVKDDLDRRDPREETPFTHPQLFQVENLPATRTKSHIKIGMGRSPNAAPLGSVWDEDWLHGNHFEVYATKRNHERDVRDRVVWYDGRRKG